MMKKILLLMVILLFIVGCVQEVPTEDVEEEMLMIPETAADTVGESTEDIVDTINGHDIYLTDEGVRYVIDPAKLQSGGPPKDGIPSIDHPTFVTVDEADEWIEDNELVIALQYKNVTRVYPLQILVWHEIVNDEVAGDPLAITYCPLCGSSIAYERVLDGESVEFGVSGKLYNSDLVMYDRKTDTYWSQILGWGIVGELSGHELTPVSTDTVTWGDWKEAHPDSEVLSQETGYTRSYGKDPYGGYYEADYLFFPVEEEDDRIHPKTIIFGVEIDGVYKAYREDELEEAGTFEDTLNGVNIKLVMDDVGVVVVTNVDTAEEIVKSRDFWFAWYAFHPDTSLYEE